MTRNESELYARTAAEQKRLIAMARGGLAVLGGILALSIVLLATACAPLAAPRTAGESLAYVESQVQAAVRTCTTLNSERRITLEQAVRCDQLTRQAFTAIDVGRGAATAGDIKSAEAQLAIVRSLLIEAEKLTRRAP